MIQGFITTAGNAVSYLSVNSALKYVMLALSTKDVWHHTVIHISSSQPGTAHYCTFWYFYFSFRTSSLPDVQ